MSSGDPETRKRILAETYRLLAGERRLEVRLEDVAKAAGISRQAVYLHFHNRTELLIATARYVDENHEIEKKLAGFRQAKGGLKTLHAYVDFWGNYIPEIYGLAKVLMVTRETDQAAAAAWDDRMKALREGCRCVVQCLEREHLLRPGWKTEDAIDFMWGMLSIPLWENLTIDKGWSQQKYLDRMKTELELVFIEPL